MRAARHIAVSLGQCFATRRKLVARGEPEAGALPSGHSRPFRRITVACLLRTSRARALSLSRSLSLRSSFLVARAHGQEALRGEAHMCP